MDKQDIIRSIRPISAGATSNNAAPLLMASMMLMIIGMVASAANGFG